MRQFSARQLLLGMSVTVRDWRLRASDGPVTTIFSAEGDKHASASGQPSASLHGGGVSAPEGDGDDGSRGGADGNAMEDAAAAEGGARGAHWSSYTDPKVASFGCGFIGMLPRARLDLLCFLCLRRHAQIAAGNCARMSLQMFWGRDLACSPNDLLRIPWAASALASAQG